MRVRGYPEFAKLFGLLTVATCAACLFQDADPSNMEDLIEVFEQTAKRGKCLANGFCHICREYKAVIYPPRSQATPERETHGLRRS
jgi:hypothetical protein